ncbi:PRD domain-containing protein [Streptococcus ferus]|uniref:BglG family transcription antiterminator LicT n=1 Tax=Streptococcus ferus TaxID=1345 RepID=UPI003517A988
MLKIDKVYNNNVVQASNTEGEELIVMGRGLGFQKKPGDILDSDRIEKTFILQNNQQLADLKQIFDALSHDEIQLINQLIRRAEVVLDTSFELSLYVALADHLHFALERTEQGLTIENPLAWEIRKFYPKEYQLGLEALVLIEERLGQKLGHSEASSIALHFVNAQNNRAIDKESYAISRLVTQILDIVRLHFSFEMDEEDTSYHRFVTHVQYFAQRVINGLVQGVNDAFLYEQVKDNYPQSFACTQKIKRFISESYQFEMSKDEQVYLTIHIQRLKRG